MSTQSLRTSSRKFSNSPAAPHQPDLHASDKRTRNPPTQPSYKTTHSSCHARSSPKSSASTTSRRSRIAMGQQPHSSHSSQQHYYLPNMATLDPAQMMEMELQTAQQAWMTATMIEDEDLMFGGKSLSTWYEEDRRRYSMGEDSAASSSQEEEEERRGRQRDRPHLHRSSHRQYKKSTKSTAEEKKH